MATEAANAPVPTVAPATPGPSKPYIGSSNDRITADLKAMEDPLPFETSTPSSTARTIKLGDINARIAPLSISADGLMKVRSDT